MIMTEIVTKFEGILRKMEELITKMEMMHKPSFSFGTGVLMHQKEIHTVQAIGRHPGINVTGLAEHTGVTKGAVSQIISRLIKKGLVRRARVPGNAKEVILELTEKGKEVEDEKAARKARKEAKKEARLKAEEEAAAMEAQAEAQGK